jgi:tripartite-type tricarboxylate transporter receptor subunit TctC
MTGFNQMITSVKAAGAALLWLCTILPAPASEFTLQGKTVTVIVSGGVGGGVDAYARTLLPHLAKHLPGNPTMVVQNLPGGGGVQGVQRLYNVEPKDGTSIATTPGGPIKSPLMGTAPVNYDLRKFSWVGSLTLEDTACVVWHTSPIKSLEDARRQEVTLSATGAGSNSTLGPLLLNDLLGTRFKPISGYDGGTSMLAVERGEVDGRCITLSSIRTGHPDWLSKKLVRFLFTVSERADTGEAGVPNVKALLKSDADRAALEFFQAADEIQNPFMLPPDTPVHIVEAYRKAFLAATKDPAYVADAEKRRQFIAPRSGEEVAAIIEAMYATPPHVIERVKRATSLSKAETAKQ